MVDLEDCNLSRDINFDCLTDLSLDRNIESITKSLSRPYFNTALKRLAKSNPDNAKLICDYILIEQTESNIKDSTKESKIKILVWLSNFHKENILSVVLLLNLLPLSKSFYKDT